MPQPYAGTFTVLRRGRTLRLDRAERAHRARQIRPPEVPAGAGVGPGDLERKLELLAAREPPVARGGGSRRHRSPRTSIACASTAAATSVAAADGGAATSNAGTESATLAHTSR